MKELINKAFTLGLGFAATSKEQIEKLVDELVKKGELTRDESSKYVDELMKKGDKVKESFDDSMEDRTKQLFEKLSVATKDDIRKLESRITTLEEAIKQKESES